MYNIDLAKNKGIAVKSIHREANVADKKDEKQSKQITAKDVEILEEWLETLMPESFSDWEKLPDIGLYMDQVLTMMDRQLAFYRRSDTDKMLTQAMVNNYTKDELLPRAVEKKYNQGHLALLSILCSLKPVLSISDLKTLLHSLHNSESEKDVYSFFLETQSETLEDVKKQTTVILESIKKTESIQDFSDAGHEMALLALRLAVDARVRLLITQKILDHFTGMKT